MKPRLPRRAHHEIPRSDVGVVPGAARLAVGAEAEDVDFAVQAGIQVLVRLTPRILRQAIEIAVGLPVGRQRRQRRARASARASPAPTVG